MAKNVTKIPATVSRFAPAPAGSMEKRKVAGYARVSTDQEEQLTSYEAQLDYYENYIKGHEGWEFAGMYSDEGISATSTAHRTGFRRMVEDALAGKIDLIITKSVSRFARNTVDSLSTIRKLKEHGTECYFEKENIWTFDSKGELLLTIMSSLAQEESRSISENVTWGHRKRFADGKASLAYSRFLGYDRGADGEFVVNEEQAVTVRLIYKLFLSGLSYHAIAKELMKGGYKAPAGGDRWCTETVQSILKNEKYKGDALLQKEYTVDFLTKKKAKNRGEVPQYYVEGHHEPIVSARKYELVQNEIARRQKAGKKYSGVSIFSSKLVCGECGSFYGSKVWHSNDRYRKVIWRCNNKYGQGRCSTPHITEDEIREAFTRAYNILLSEGDSVMEDLEAMREIRCGTGRLQEKLDVVTAELSVLVRQTERLIADNAVRAQDQAEYAEKYNGLVEKYEAKKAEHDRLKEKIDSAKAAGAAIDDFEAVFREHGEAVREFDPELWGCMVGQVTINTDGGMVFLFKSGYEITV